MAELNTFRELTDAEIDMVSGTDMAERGRPRIWDDLFDLELYKTVEAHRMSWMRRKLPSLASACKTTPCVREVAAYIGSGPWGRWTKVNGSIQSEVQRARSRAVVAAGEFTGRSGVTNGWDQRHDTGALAG